MSVKRLRFGYVTVFSIGVLLVALGVYGIYYFSTIGHGRSTIFFGGIGSIIFGSVFIRLSYPFFVPVKKYFIPPENCPRCGAILKKNVTVCEKCKQQLDSTNY